MSSRAPLKSESARYPKRWPPPILRSDLRDLALWNLTHVLVSLHKPGGLLEICLYPGIELRPSVRIEGLYCSYKLLIHLGANRRSRKFNFVDELPGLALKHRLVALVERF